MIIIDAGSRYGLHPTFDSLSNFAEIYLFEPDAEEATRLKSKYAKYKNFKVKGYGLGSSSKEMTLNIKGHPALSTTCELNASLFDQSNRKYQQQSIARQSIEIKRLDQVVDGQPDFYKLDIEGMELEALIGAGDLIHGMAGIRCEVQLQQVHKGCSTFSEIDQWLNKLDFELISIDNLSAGRLKNRFASAENDGKLLSCDAVWMHKSNTSNRISFKKKIIFVLWQFINGLGSEALEGLYKLTTTQSVSEAVLGNRQDKEVCNLLLSTKKHILGQVLSLAATNANVTSDINQIYKKLFQTTLPETHLIRYEIESIAEEIKLQS